MLTWVKGTAILNVVSRKQDATLDWLVNTLEKKPPHRVNGTAVFLTGNPHAAPSALLHNLKHNHMLHERNIILTIKTVDVPRVPNNERVKIDSLSDTFTGVSSRLRLHGDAERRAGSAAVPQARPQRGPRGHLVLPVAPRAAADLSLADAPVAGDGSSSGSPAAPRTRPPTSRSPPIAWSRSARRSWFECRTHVRCRRSGTARAPHVQASATAGSAGVGTTRPIQHGDVSSLLVTREAND